VTKVNNVVEDFYSKLGKVLLTHHSDIWKFIENIKHVLEEIENIIKYIQISGGHIRIKPPVSEKITANQKRVENI